MVDTVRSYDDLNALLADNKSGEISAQDLRDFLITVFKSSAALSCFEANHDQENIGTTGTLLTAYTNEISSSVITASAANDNFTVSLDGYYRLTFGCSFSATNGAIVKFRVRVNGVEKPFGTTRNVGSGDIGSCGFVGLLDLVAGNVVTIYVHSNGATDDVNISDSQCVLKFVG